VHLARYTGLFQADAYTGYQDLYDPGRRPGPLIEAACWAHARRPFFQMANVEEAARRKAHNEAGGALSPIAIDVVRRMDEIFALERDLWGMPPDRRLAERQSLVRPLVTELREAMMQKRAALSPKHDLAKAMTYMLKRWPAFIRFLDDGRACMTNNAAERAIRGVALGRKSWLFAGSDRGGQRAASMLSLIVTARMNDVDPRAWLADVLARIAGHPARQLDDLLPWIWKVRTSKPSAKAA
jgi:transposase